jgi:hypothetical protein
VKERQTHLDAVEAGLRDFAELRKFPAATRVPAMRTVATLELRAGAAATAGAIAKILAADAKEPGDAFAAAKVFAGCAGGREITEDARVGYATDAVRQLKAAIKLGFRDPDALAGPDWNAVRERSRDFQSVLEELQKLRDAKK